uniref:Uncharacterized protein n=1 Tax=Ixodes ricinus TaxID=34613 RepID=A0A6B0UD06_IXORI
MVFLHLLFLGGLPVGVEIFGHALPFLVVVRVKLSAVMFGPLRHRHVQRTLDHERHRSFADALWDQFDCPVVLVPLGADTMRGHHAVKGGTSGLEALLAGFVFS